jgi:hypothetical protein
MNVQTAVTFIVRMTRDSAGTVKGVIERASTGAKRPVEGCDAVGPAIAEMLKAEKERAS